MIFAWSHHVLGSALIPKVCERDCGEYNLVVSLLSNQTVKHFGSGVRSLEAAWIYTCFSQDLGQCWQFLTFLLTGGHPETHSAHPGAPGQGSVQESSF